MSSMSPIVLSIWIPSFGYFSRSTYRTSRYVNGLYFRTFLGGDFPGTNWEGEILSENPHFPFDHRTPYPSQYNYMDVSENNGTPKSSILIGFSIINHPFWDTPIFGNTHMYLVILLVTFLGWWKRDPLTGESWPPTRGSEGHFESPGMYIYIYISLYVPWYMITCLDLPPSKKKLPYHLQI